MPDPTPDDPEPLRVQEDLPAVPDLDPDLDGFSLPDAPAPPSAAPAHAIPWRPGITKPIRVAGDLPGYTEPARLARVQGIVTLRAVIGASGAITELELVKGLPLGLTQSALDAVAEWRFEPARLDDRPVAVIYHLAIEFSLH